MDDHPKNIVDIHEDARRYTLHDGKIIVHEANGHTHDMFDAIFDSTLDMVENWSHETPYTELIDARGTQATPYARQRVGDLSKYMGIISGRTAVIVDDTTTGRMISFFINTIFVRFSTKRELKVFTDYDDGLIWLKSYL